MKYSLTLALVITLVFASACANTSNIAEDNSTIEESSIVGYWASVQGGARGSWEFTDDGKLRIGEGPWMQYSLTGKDSVMISMNGGNASESFYKLNQDKLSIYFDADRKNLISDFNRGRNDEK